MNFLLASLIGTAILIPAALFAAEDDVPPSAAPSAPQSTLQTGTHAPSKLEARFTTQWSGGSSTAQTSAEAAPRVAPRIADCKLEPVCLRRLRVSRVKKQRAQKETATRTRAKPGCHM
jgi:hypothetical protein